MRHLYTIFFYLATPIILIRLWIKSRQNPAYRLHWGQRFGRIPLIKNKKTIWVHAVSLGESIAATPLIEKILTRFTDATLVVTTTTPTGRAEIQKRFGNRVLSYYTPYDLPHVLRRFLRNVHPNQTILMETELWPNLLYLLKKRRIPTVIVNARLSERSMKNYLRFRRFLKPLLATIKISAQSKADAKRFQEIGARRENIFTTGNIKFDSTLPDSLLPQAKALRQYWINRPVLIAASTHEGEENILLQAFKKIRAQFPTALFILVPRHPERFAKVAELCRSCDFTVTQRSTQELPNENTAIYLGDTMGELKLLYAASDVAFVGGSLVPIGGHNLIEPASLSLPILTGPNLQNFIAVRDLLEEAEALLITDNADAIASQVIRLFHDTDLRHQLGARALSMSEQNRGAISRNLDLFELQSTL